jgi:2-polyprenyl-3-methyl-5-hydroxy-6-metoxy-1,4-benzoquinol methylase
MSTLRVSTKQDLKEDRLMSDDVRAKRRGDWRSILVRLFGMRATLIHWDTLVLDRWLWVSKRLPPTSQHPMLCDVGCGTGSFTIGAALRGYTSVGLSWDERNQRVAAERAAMCGDKTSSFEVLDVRRLDSRPDFRGVFDVILCTEVIEHIADDGKLIRDMAACLKPGGRLLLTTPYEHYRAITASDEGPFIMDREDGWHVRRGYTEARLQELCQAAGLSVDAFSYCSGILSQKITFLLRTLSRVHRLVGLAAILPLRILPPLFDPWLTKSLGWPCYSICLEAHRIAPRGNAK